jgi:hypothetical protein
MMVFSRDDVAGRRPFGSGSWRAQATARASFRVFVLVPRTITFNQQFQQRPPPPQTRLPTTGRSSQFTQSVSDASCPVDPEPHYVSSRSRLPHRDAPSRHVHSPRFDDTMAGRSKVPAIGSAGWILEERHQSNDLVSQELEDFGFSVRNELEWLNEHMADICANNGQYVAPAFFGAPSVLTSA